MRPDDGMDETLMRPDDGMDTKSTHDRQLLAVNVAV